MKWAQRKLLQQRLIAARICIECQLESTIAHQRCPVCHQRNLRRARERYRENRDREIGRKRNPPAHPVTKRAVMARHRIKSYVTAKKKGLIK